MRCDFELTRVQSNLAKEVYVDLVYWTDGFSLIQGETGPSGPTGASGARGAPVSTSFGEMHVTCTNVCITVCSIPQNVCVSQGL